MDFMISHFCDEENHPAVYKNTRKRSIQDGAFAPMVSGNAEIGSDSENRLPPEMELGNIEYKAKLVNPSLPRLEHLITQMKWRLREGQGEAIYEVGVEDGGQMSGLSDLELKESIFTLKNNGRFLECQHGHFDREGRDSKRQHCTSYCRRSSRTESSGEPAIHRTQISSSRGLGYDGNGKTRLNLFRYPHEVRTGKTSSICLDVIGFDNKGKLINYAKNTLEELVEKSSKLVTLIDLAGDSKYLKTTIHGLSGYSPHFSCLLVSAETGPTATTREHLGLIAALNIPLFVVVTKIDLVDKETLSGVLRNVRTLLSRAGMTSHGKMLKTTRDVVRAAQKLQTSSIVPILSVSSVTGEGFRLLRTLLNLLSTAGTSESRLQLASEPAHFSIEELYNVPHVGTVVGGMLAEGQLPEGADVLVGPMKDGSFAKTKIGSIYRCKQPIRCVFPGEVASIALTLPPNVVLRRGMVLTSNAVPPMVCHRFVANLFLLYSSTRVSEGFQATVYIGSVCQTATVCMIDGTALQQGKWSRVELRFAYQPEAIRAGCPIIFRQGKTKGMGEVIELLPQDA
ncbi:unnamed protein product [Caenorhabditis auriculariae]|uniref:Tr-type G domain-containing protein n=1 Tax=Caenorhabditis auriculariae TaxID=2777116 RepID=A0A8S1GTB3_9PELO|nr:unnamed protein product [Caenorhabditis auriculariae]